MGTVGVELQPAAVAIVDGVKTYGSGDAAVRALDRVSLEVPTSTWVAVMGPSGSGKSTLLHCLAGLERLDGGRVWLGANEITAASDAELTRLRRTEVGFAFQNFNLVSSLALAALYTTMAVVNAVVIAGTGRRREHAVARLSGLTRGQVVTTTALEAAITTVTALILGLIVVASAVVGIALAARRSVDATVVEIPWTLLAATSLGSLVIAIGTAMLVALRVTHPNPITVAAARE